ncbi:phosphorylated virion membrane protein [Turkeypox virus]|uniref:Phosphorylated virion membrane protein n=1 Tax=Turkeypox virus TaxID=336486 RepID=A0A0M3PB62_9POXV|nr:phosphorylated virion membrane protein [Turkeypox virus]ALA62506.1 phosphorylated virion membrane protein [Turkeypox virus]
MNNSYLNYYNVYDVFDAGAGIKEKDLFTEEQQLSFLPKAKFDGMEKLFSNIFNNDDVKSLIALIMVVLAINTESIISLVFVVISAFFVPVPSLIIAYCVAMYIKNPDGGYVGISALLMLASIITIYLTSSSRIPNGFRTVIDIILLVILGFYTIKVYGVDRQMRLNRQSCSKSMTPSYLEKMNPFQRHSNY